MLWLDRVVPIVFIVVVPHEPIGTRSKAVARDGYKTMFDLVCHHQPRLSPPLCLIRPAQLPKHGRRTSWAIPPAFVKYNTGTPAIYHLQPVDVTFVMGVPHSGAVVKVGSHKPLESQLPGALGGALKVPLDEVQLGVSLFFKQHQPALPSRSPLRAGFPGTWSPSQKAALCHINHTKYGILEDSALRTCMM